LLGKNKIDFTAVCANDEEFWHDNVNKLVSIKHPEFPSTDELVRLREKYHSNMLALEKSLYAKKPTVVLLKKKQNDARKRKSAIEAERLLTYQLEGEVEEGNIKEKESENRKSVKRKGTREESKEKKEKQGKNVDIKEKEPEKKKEAKRKGPREDSKEEKDEQSEKKGNGGHSEQPVEDLIEAAVLKHLKSSGISSTAQQSTDVSLCSSSSMSIINRPAIGLSPTSLAPPGFDFRSKIYSPNFNASPLIPLHVPSRYEIWQQQQLRMLEERNRALESNNIMLYDALSAVFIAKQ
jgi:hypothetical protein